MTDTPTTPLPMDQQRKRAAWIFGPIIVLIVAVGIFVVVSRANRTPAEKACDRMREASSNDAFAGAYLAAIGDGVSANAMRDECEALVQFAQQLIQP